MAVISLLLAFNTMAWSVWIIVFVLILIAWRPYVWDWVVFLTANLAMGAIAMQGVRLAELALRGLERT